MAYFLMSQGFLPVVYVSSWAVRLNVLVCVNMHSPLSEIPKFRWVEREVDFVDYLPPVYKHNAPPKNQRSISTTIMT
jgi:hypothetical protein